MNKDLLSRNIKDFSVFYSGEEEFRGLVREIFSNNLYYFETEKPNPRIIDAGAHIGLSSLYFKYLYPEAEITAIEPLPQNFELLEINLETNRLDKVELHQVALSDQKEESKFYFDQTKEKWYSTASLIEKAWDGSQESTSIKVPTELLAQYIDGPIDFLKLDIEGAETKVLEASKDKLKLVDQMIVEYHPGSSSKRFELTEMLEDLGFKIHVFKEGKQIRKYHSPNALVVIQAQK